MYKILLLATMTLTNCVSCVDQGGERVSIESDKYGRITDTFLPNVLVLGDSISIGYTGPVSEILGDVYDVRHPDENCKNSYYTLENVDRWLEEYPKNDIITWNNGLWDTFLDEYRSPNYPADWYGTDLEDYEDRLILIARKLKATGARVIFFTTTDIPSGAYTFEVGKEIQLNEIAKRVLPAEGVEVVDLNEFALTITAHHYNEADVHYTDRGNELLGEFVSDVIMGE